MDWFSIIFLVVVATGANSDEDSNYYFNWGNSSEDVIRPAMHTRLGPENQKRPKSHHHVHKTGVIDLKPGSFITFSSKNNNSLVKVQSVTNQTHTDSSVVNSVSPNVINLTLTQAVPAENTTFEDNIRLLDSITFPDEVQPAKPTMTTIIITTITNSTTTITFSTDSTNLKNTLPTTRSDMSSITTTTVITQPVQPDNLTQATENNG